MQLKIPTDSGMQSKSSSKSANEKSSPSPVGSFVNMLKLFKKKRFSSLFSLFSSHFSFYFPEVFIASVGMVLRILIQGFLFKMKKLKDACTFCMNISGINNSK